MEILIEHRDGSTELVKFDATIEENFDHTAMVTSHPVDSGGNISDHVNPTMPRITADVVVSNTPAVPVDTQMDGVSGSVQPRSFNVTLPDRRPRVDPTGFAPGIPQPAIITAQLLTFNGIVNRVRTVWDLLIELQESGTPFTILTGLRDYSDMVLERISTSRTAETGTIIQVQIDMVQIRRAVSRDVAAPEPVEPRGKGRKNRGNQPSDEDEDKTVDEDEPRSESLLHRLLN